MALKKDLKFMQTYDYKKIAQTPPNEFIPVKRIIVDLLYALDKSGAVDLLREHSILEHWESHTSYSFLHGHEFNNLILKFFSNFSLQNILVEENFLYQLHIIITYDKLNGYFPESHPYHQPLEDIIPLRVFHTFDLNAILERVYTYIRTEQPHWYILRDLYAKLSQKNFHNVLCITPKIIQDYVQIWENRGGKIIFSPKYAKKRAICIQKNQCPYFTGVDRVDWGDGSRLRSVRYNLQKEAIAIRQQIFSLLERIPNPYNYHRQSSASVSTTAHFKHIKHLSAKYLKVLNGEKMNEKDYNLFLLTLQPEELAKWVELCEARIENLNLLNKKFVEVRNMISKYQKDTHWVLMDFKTTHTKH